MYDSLVHAIEIVEPDSKFMAVFSKGFNLLSRNRIGDRQTAAMGRHRGEDLGTYQPAGGQVSRGFAATRTPGGREGAGRWVRNCATSGCISPPARSWR